MSTMMRIAVGDAASACMAIGAAMTADSAGAVSMMYCTSSADLASTCIPALCRGHTFHKSGASFQTALAISSLRMAVAAVVLCAR